MALNSGCSSALSLSRKLERNLEKLIAEQNDNERRDSSAVASVPLSKGHPIGFGRHGLHYQNFDESCGETAPSLVPSILNTDAKSFEELEEKALNLAIKEVHEASNRQFLPWAANGKASRLGEIILLVGSTN